MKKNVLLTGVAGFIGSKIAQLLILEGHSVIGIDNLKTGFLDNVPKGVKFVFGDCGDPEVFLDELISKTRFDMIIHFAGQSSGEISFDDPVQDLSDNCISTLNLLQFAKRTSCTKFIFASSMSVYGNSDSSFVDETCATEPLSMYAVGKLASEHYLRIFQCYGISSVSLRLFNTYGPGQNMDNLRQGMISIYLAQALKNGSIQVKGSADRFRDFVFIDDVTAVVSHFVATDFLGAEVYNVCTGSRTTVSAVIETIKNTIDKVNVSVAYIESTPGDQFGIVGCNKKLKRELSKNKDFLSNSDFTEIKAGIKKFVESLG